jgi:2',3'-cyclic-nucleotide 2'-phosphodiesterase (5'-nucleotidase family)
MENICKTAFRIQFVLFCAVTAQTIDKDWLTDILGENNAHTTCTFLSLPTSAGAMGTGCVASTGMLDATDVHSFTAATALGENNQFTLTHLEWYMGLRNEFAGATFPLLSIGTIGVFSQVFTAGSDPYAFTIDEQPSNFSVFECAIGGSFARSFFDQSLCLGGSIYYIESRLDDVAGRALALSTDLRYMPYDWMQSTCYMRHLGTPLKYTATSEPLPVQTGVSIGIAPLQYHDPEYGTQNTIRVITGIEKTADEPMNAALGLELKPYRYMTLRGGYEYPFGVDASIAGASAGIGFSSKKYSVDGAWKIQSRVFGSIWAATLAMEIESLTPRSAEEYEKFAELSFGQGRYKDCIAYAKKALRLDPNLWKARTLLGKAQSEILRRKRLEIAIIYTGNIQGQFLPPYHPQSLGGLARQATIINTLRGQFPVALSVAAGNMITASSIELKVKIAHRYYRYIKHDAVCLGQGEFEYDAGMFLDADSARVPFLCIEGEALERKGVMFRTVVEKDGYSFVILSAANTPETIKALSAKKTSLAEEIRLELQRHDARKATLRIVVLHDSWENIKSYAPSLEGADVVICGSLSARFETPLKLGSALAVSAGKAGEFVGNLTMRFDQKKHFLSYDNRLIPVTASIPADTSVAMMVSAITSEIELKERGLSRIDVKKAATQGVFPFLSTRSGSQELYLKIIDKLTEFPLTSSGMRAGTPAISFTAGKIAFTIDDTVSGCRPLYAIDLTGAQKRLLADSASIHEAIFSPDGAWLYYAASACNDSTTDLYRMRPDSGVQFPVAVWDGTTERSIAFSPDFSEVVFCSNRDRSWQIYLTDPEGTHPLRLTDESGNHIQPAFSPDGSSISYLSDNANTSGNMELWLFDRSAGTHRQLTSNTAINSYCWLGDSRTIIISSGLDFPELLAARIDSDSMAVQSFIRSSSAIRQHYKEIDPRVITWKDQEKVIYVREYEDGRRQIYWVSADGNNDQPLVRSSTGSDWLK